VDTTLPGGRFRLAVIDAQPLFRAGVTSTLRAFKAVETVVEGESAADALQIAGKMAIDVMLIDLAIAGGGADAVATITRMWPATRLIIITASERAEDVSAALQCGARGYLLKQANGTELFHAVRSVLNGEVYLTPSLGARLFAQSQAQQSRQATGIANIDLTPREDQILSQVSVGATNKEIALKLNISEKTVKYYMTNIMQKLHVRNRVEAVVAARKRVNHQPA
jgi:two-component system, NarL family, nitrate/nitrite response regulator NarL